MSTRDTMRRSIRALWRRNKRRTDKAKMSAGEANVEVAKLGDAYRALYDREPPDLPRIWPPVGYLGEADVELRFDVRAASATLGG